MKTIQIHPLSALAGAAVLGLVVLATGAAPQTLQQHVIPVQIVGGEVNVREVAREIVRIDTGGQRSVEYELDVHTSSIRCQREVPS